MAKRKSDITDEGSKSPASSSKRVISVKKPKIILEEEHTEDDQGSSEEEEEKVQNSKKKVRNETKDSESQKKGKNIAVHKSSEGDKYIDLGKKKRATVRSFKGSTLVDIREYYETNGEEKPGKKGISLTFEQWEVLRNGASVIDELLEQEKKK